jgi:hypothetical protein
LEDGSGGAVVSWTAADTSGDVYVSRLGASGAIVPGWQGEPAGRGVPVCSAPGLQQNPVAVPGREGAFIVVWEDHRAGNWDIYAAHLTPDGTVPILATLVSARAETDAVYLTWWSPEREAFELWRREGGRPWASLEQIIPDGGGLVTYEDRDILPGRTYSYRLERSDPEDGSPHYFGETSITVPERPVFALHKAWPNPGAGELFVSFSIVSGVQAEMDILDAAGRRVGVERIPGPSGGSQILRLRHGAGLPSGMYLLRLKQGARSASRKLFIRKP